MVLLWTNLTNLNPMNPRMLCAKFGWKWPSGSGKEDFYMFSMYFYYFTIISPFRKVWPFIWTNLNRFHPRMFCARSDWKWPSGSAEEIFFVKVCQFFFIISQLSPIWERRGPSFEILNSLNPGILCAKFGWNWPSGSGEEDENVKSFTDGRTDRQTDSRRTTVDQKSSLELSAKVS